MKSSILWNAFKPYTGHVWSLFRYLKFYFRKIAIPVSFLFLLGCSEKTPILPLSNSQISFDSVAVAADLMSDTTIFAEPAVGANSYLFVGEDDNLKAYSLLLFNNLGSPLDTLPEDQVLSCELVLRTGSYLKTDTTTPNLTMAVVSLEGDGLEGWSEDSANSINFDLSNYTLTECGTFNYASADTFFIDLLDYFKTKWRDTSINRYGFAINPEPGSDAGLGVIFSGETNYYPYIAISYIDGDGDTSRTTLTCIEDLTITEFKRSLMATPQPLLISSGKAAYTFIKFRVDEVITDENLFIAGANLYLHIDPDLTEGYGNSYTIYVSLLDSTRWEDLTFTPASASYVASRTFTSADSLLALKIPNTVQLFTSGYNGNFGVALWISPSAVYPGLLAFYPTEAPDPTLRPSMKILTMLEE